MTSCAPYENPDVTGNAQKPRVVLVEDRPERVELVETLSDSFEVCPPESPQELKQNILFESFDGGVFDIDLTQWKIDTNNPTAIDGRTISDGIDVLRLYAEMHPGSARALHSAHFEEQRFINKLNRLQLNALEIRKPIGNEEDYEKKFKEFRETAERAIKRRLAVTMTPGEYRALTYNEVTLLYERARAFNASWVNVICTSMPSIDWLVICGPKIAICGSLSTGFAADPLEVGSRAFIGLPNQLLLENVPGADSIVPYVFWNTSDLERVKTFLHMSGFDTLTRQSKHSLGLSAATPLVEGYLDRKVEVLELISKLTFGVQLKVLKRIYKKLVRDKEAESGGATRLDAFTIQCRHYSLPQIIDVLPAKILAMDDEDQTAWVQLEKDGEPVANEPMDGAFLRDRGVKHLYQPFEYVLCKFANDDVLPFVDLVELGRGDPFEDTSLED